MGRSGARMHSPYVQIKNGSWVTAGARTSHRSVSTGRVGESQRNNFSRGRETRPWLDRTTEVQEKKTTEEQRKRWLARLPTLEFGSSFGLGLVLIFVLPFKSPHLPLHWLSRGGVVRRRLVDPTSIAANGVGSQRRQYACCPSAKRMSKIVYFSDKPTTSPRRVFVLETKTKFRDVQQDTA